MIRMHGGMGAMTTRVQTETAGAAQAAARATATAAAANMAIPFPGQGMDLGGHSKLLGKHSRGYCLHLALLVD